MPFYIYRTTGIANSALEYHDRRSVVLAGGGLIRAASKEQLGGKETGWTITDDDILATGGYHPPDHALVIDTAPRRSSVSLFEVTSISGYSYADWTPIMLTLEQLFVDEETPRPDLFKEKFGDKACERCIVRSFLYLTGGYAGGSWNFGGNSRTTAALLWENAWGYFSEQTSNVSGSGG